MSMKQLRVCDYCGKPLEEVTKRGLKEELLLTTVSLSASDGINVFWDHVSNGAIHPYTDWIQGIDACNVIHLSLALKEMSKAWIK